MSNWLTLGGRGFLRSSAVYRCLARYGATEEWAIDRLRSVMPERDAVALVQSWRGVLRVRQTQRKEGGR